MNNIKLRDLCKNHSFWSFMRLTKKYREFQQTESKYSIYCMLVILIYFYMLNSELLVIELLKNVIYLITPVLIGTIGFIFSGLALMATIITHKVVKQIDKDEKIVSVAGILFSFYFCSGLIVAALFSAGVFLLLTYNGVYLWFKCGQCIMWLTILWVLYFHIFSLLYAVSLLGSCLKFFFLNVYYTDRCSQISHTSQKNID